MRNRLPIVATTVVAGLLAMLPVTASASSAVLVAGVSRPGASPVNPGAQLVATATGSVTFTGGVAVTCSSSNIAATVLTNPTVPGTATLSVTGFSFSGCTGADSVSFDNLPYTLSISDATSPPTATLRRGDSGPIRLEVKLPRQNTCIYEPQDTPISTTVTDDGFQLEAGWRPVPGLGTGPCLKAIRGSGPYGAFQELDNMRQVFVN